MMERRRIVCIGGGTGQSQILRALAAYPVDVTAIVGVTDNGGHSGLLRRAYGVPQVGDIRNCLAAMAPDDDLLGQLLRYRFPDGALEGTSLGNLLVLALIQVKGSLSAAIDALESELGVHPRILPVSDSDTQIGAELEDGRRVVGEWEIIGREPRTPIRRLFHEPEVPCLPEAAAAIREADLLVFCPGTLQTGILSVVVTRGVREAIRESSARKVQIVNIMTQPGNTDGFTARDHVELLTRTAGVPPDAVIVNSRRPPDSWLEIYATDGAEPVEVDLPPGAPYQVLAEDLLEPEGKDVLTLYQRAGQQLTAGPHFIRHDPVKTGRMLVALLSE